MDIEIVNTRESSYKAREENSDRERENTISSNFNY